VRDERLLKLCCLRCLSHDERSVVLQEVSLKIFQLKKFCRLCNNQTFFTLFKTLRILNKPMKNFVVFKNLLFFFGELICVSSYP
jgi:hypothetical protein